DPDEAALIADYRKDHVGVRLGQVVERLYPLPESPPEDPTGTKADQRLHVLETGASRILPGVEECEQAVTLVRRGTRGDRGQSEDEAVGGAEERQPRPRD